jgi:hypothetical protein
MHSDRLLYTIGNLSAGNTIYGVEAEQEFGSFDVYGPFRENEANTFAHQLVEDRFAEQRAAAGITERYVSVKVVRFELPQAGHRIVRNADGAYEYAV